MRIRAEIPQVPVVPDRCVGVEGCALVLDLVPAAAHGLVEAAARHPQTPSVFDERAEHVEVTRDANRFVW